MLEHAKIETMDRVANIVDRLLAKQGSGRAITATDNLGKIGLTSADMVDLMLTVEEEFDIKIPDRELRPSNFRSISSIDALVRSLMPKP